jgi:hypothetical protein
VWLLLNEPVPSTRTRWFFSLQPLIFPLGFPFFLILYPIHWEFLSGKMDREGIIDIPFIWCVAHPTWVLVSTTIAAVLWGNCFRKRQMTGTDFAENSVT